MADIEVPEFNTLEQFINWCQDSLVQEILKKKPESHSLNSPLIQMSNPGLMSSSTLQDV
jgi:hypothetical protein